MGARYKHDLQTGSTLVHHCGAGRAGLEPVERGREVLRLFGRDVRSFALTLAACEVARAARAYFSGALDRPLLSCRLGTDVSNLLKDGGIRKPVANPTYKKRLKRNRRETLALGSGFCRPSQ